MAAAPAYFGDWIAIGPFDKSKERFDSYFRRMTMFFVANNIEDEERRKCAFLYEVGQEVFSTLEDLVAPADPLDMTLAELEKCLKDYYHPARLEMPASYQFMKREQRSSESVSGYIEALKTLYLDCNYPKCCGNKILRDRFVCGLHDSRIRQSLLVTGDMDEKMTFQRACQVATSMEIAKDRSLRMRQDTPSKGTKVVSKRDSSKTVHCYRCGNNHLAKDCPHKNVECHKCSKRGHFAKFCKTKQKGKDTKSGKKSKSGKSKSLKSVTEAGSDSDDSNFYDF